MSEMIVTNEIGGNRWQHLNIADHKIYQVLYTNRLITLLDVFIFLDDNMLFVFSSQSVFVSVIVFV